MWHVVRRTWWVQYGNTVGNGPSLDVPLEQPPPSPAPSNGAHVQSASRYLHGDKSGEIDQMSNTLPVLPVDV